MIREERSQDFWRDLLAHPDVVHAMHGYDLDIGPAILSEKLVPLATEHGGYLFWKLEVAGDCYDLHAAFRPEGWGRPASIALKESLALLKPELILATQTTQPMSRPPLSFGFRPADEWRETFLGMTRTWFLTRAAWLNSPAHRSFLKCRPS